MAIIAKAQITISRIVDIASTTRYYLLQSSTASKPPVPTTNPPGGSWITTEPSYTSGSTNTLYFVDLTVFTNNTFKYSAVSKSSSYEAAKAAYNKAMAAQNTANNAQQDIDNMIIGGRNLFSWMYETEDGISTHLGEEEYILAAYNNVGSLTQFNDCLTFDPVDTVGETYSISFWAKSPNGNTRLMVCNLSDDPRYFKFSNTFSNTLGTSWSYYTYTFTNIDNGDTYTNLFNRIEIYAPDQIGVVVKKIKIENGNKPTDWTPAPEDMASTDLVESTRNDLSDFIGDISNELDNMANNVTDNKDTITDAILIIEENSEKIASLIQDAAGITMNFETLNTTVTQINDELFTEIDERVKYIRFEDGEIWLGKEIEENEEDLKVSISNQRMCFWQNNTEVAYLSDNKLYITDAQITSTLRIGNFEISVRSNGNMGVNWVD